MSTASTDVTDWLRAFCGYYLQHFAVDYFRAEFNWFLGERQVLHSASGGMTVTW